MRVIRDEQLGRYRVLEIDGEKPPIYTHYRIGGELFKPVLTHNLKPEFIAIEDTRSHEGEEIHFEKELDIRDDFGISTATKEAKGKTEAERLECEKRAFELLRKHTDNKTGFIVPEDASPERQEIDFFTVL